MVTLEDLGIVEIWAEVRIEVRYRGGAAQVPVWTQEEREALARAIGLHPKVYWVRPGHTTRDSQDRTIQYMYSEAHAGGEE